MTLCRIQLHVNRRAMKRHWAILHEGTLSFYRSDEQVRLPPDSPSLQCDTPSFGPLSMSQLLFVAENCTDRSTIDMVFAGGDPVPLYVQLQVESPREHWMLLLTKSTAPVCDILAEFDACQVLPFVSPIVHA